MVSQQAAANQMFRQNSQRLQQTSEARRNAQSPEQAHSGADELSFVKDSGRRNYRVLKQEQADRITKDASDDQTPEHSSGEDELTFVKDGGREDDGEPKQELADTIDQSAAEDQAREQAAGGQDVNVAQDDPLGSSGEREQDAEAIAKDAAIDQTPQQSASEEALTFVKDGDRGNDVGMNQAQARSSESELTFAKDQGQDLSQGR